MSARELALSPPMILRQKPAWSACPNCRLDLAVRPRGSALPLIKCPECGIAIVSIWWQRCLVSMLGLTLALGIPAAVGVRGILSLSLASLLLMFPAAREAYAVIFKLLPVKYVWKNEVVTLFQRPF